MIPRNVNSGGYPSNGTSADLNSGSVTVYGLATLAARSLAGLIEPTFELSFEAKVLLRAAAKRGILEVKGNPDAFDSTERLLAVAVETEEGSWLVFREKANPKRTLAFLEGLKQLCQNGLVIHHLQNEFSLTQQGFALPVDLPAANLEEALGWAQLLEHS